MFNARAACENEPEYAAICSAIARRTRWAGVINKATNLPYKGYGNVQGSPGPAPKPPRALRSASPRQRPR